MMVSSSSNMDLSAILQTLESKKTNLDDKIEAYTSLSSHLKEEELSFASLDLTKQSDRVLAVLKRDIQSDSSSVQQGALEILGFCLHDVEIVRSLSTSSSSQLLTLLRHCVEKTEDKTVATRALWCLSQQKCGEAVVVKELPFILEACYHAFTKWKGQSTAVEHEAINAISRFVEQVPAEMKLHCSKWGRHTIPLIVHPAIKIREKSLALLETTVAWLEDSKELKHALVPEFKSKVCAELKKLFVKNEIYVLRTWALVVKMFAEELHHGSFINSILPIAELGFKHASPDVKVEAFKAWKSLIDNFSLNPSIICDQKRVKLVMQVFKINNAKLEAVAKEKLKIWWHFVKALGVKISQNFDQVLVPLLHFCLGGMKTATSTTPGTPHMGMKNMISSPATPCLNLATCSPGLSRPVFASIQVQGCEVIARILACPSKMSDLPRINISFESLSSEVITGTPLFLKHSSVIISTTLDLICAQGPHIPESLLMYIWQCLMYHLRHAIESSSKSENREAFSCFLGHFQTLVFSQTLSTKLIMKLFQSVCGLPQKALSSTAYSINSGEVVRGTPALYLCEVLLAPTLLKDLASSENFITLFSTLINCGTSSMTGVLEFCQAVLDVLSRHASFITNPESLWRLWSVVAHTLQEHTVKSNEVNQGDSLEYNFDCMYAALLLPLKHRLGTKLSQPVCKSLLKTWGELYHTFARLSALVTNAEPNIACEELCQKTLLCLNEDETKDIAVIEMLTQICQTIIDNLDFSSLGQTTSFSHGATLSPSKWIKRKQKPMENLHSYIKLLVRLLEDLESLAEQEPTIAAKQKPVMVTAAATCLVDVLATLFTHVTVSNLIAKVMTQLATPTSWFYSASARKSCSKLFSSAFMQKLDKLWLDISTCIQSRYTMPYDSDFLTCVSPLFRETLLHPRRQIKNQALILWKATFSHSAPLTYPEDLKPVLLKVKEKTPILLPGWVQSETTEIEETPFSQFSQMDSQAPTPHLPGLPSPHKILGRFMNKAVSPNIKRSPAKAAAVSDSPAVHSAKKKLLVTDLRDEDFVVIKASPKKKRVLTEHQKEVMKERRSLPVMYNNLDLSQDMSLMSQFNTDTQQESILVPSQSQNDSVIVINSSQSQNQDADKTSDKSKSSSSESEDVTDVRRGRRRSVRLSTEDQDTQEDKEEKTEMKAPSTRSKRTKKETSEDKKTEKSDQKEAKEVESSKQSSESMDVDPSPSLKQNLLHAIGDQWLNTQGSKSSSSSVGKGDSSVDKTSSDSDKNSQKSNSESSQKTNSQNSQKINSQSSQNSQGSQETTKHFSPFKSLSQSPPERKSRSPGRKTRSQEHSSSKSPKGRERGSQSGALDRWLVKSPSKTKSPVLDPSHDDSFVPNTQSPKESVSLLMNVVEDTMSPKKGRADRSSHSFVEDTQSPSKFSQQSMFSPDVNASIEETPTKEEGRIDIDAIVSSRALFSEEKKEEDVAVGTPVIKIKKLTSEEIVELTHSSPEKEVVKSLFKEPEPVSKDTGSEIPCSQGFQTASGNVNQLNSELSSGFDGLFDTQKSEESSQESEGGFTGILSAEQKIDLSHASSSSSAYSTSIVTTGVGSQESDLTCPEKLPASQEVEASQNKDEFTEELFKTCPEMEKSFNPDAESTLKEGSSQSSASSKSSQSTGPSQSSQGAADEQSQDEEFDPDEMSTLQEKSGMGRRRKQDSPKRLNENDVRRTPRQRKKKTFDDFEVETLSGGKAEGTPSRRGRTPGKKNESEIDGSQKSTRRSSRKSEVKPDESESEKEDEKSKRKRKKAEDEKSSQESNSQASQEEAEREAKRKTRKRKHVREESDENIPLSQIKTKLDPQTSSQDAEDKSSKVEDEDSGMPKKKRVRKSLAAEMISSESQDDDKSQSSQNSSQENPKPRRIQLQPVEKTSNTVCPVFQKDLETETKTNIMDDSESLNTESKDHVLSESQSVQHSEIIFVGMETDSSKSLNEQTQEESQLAESEEVSKGESTPTNKPSSAPLRRSTTKQKMEEARKRSISKKSDKNDDSSVEDDTEWKPASASTSTEKKEPEQNNDVDTQMDFLASQVVNKAVANLDMSFCKDSPHADQEKIKGTVDTIISSLASPVLPKKAAKRKRKQPLPKPKTASPLSVRLRSSRLVLRARAKLGSKTVSKASPLALSLSSSKRKHSQELKVQKLDLESEDNNTEKNEKKDEGEENVEKMAEPENKTEVKDSVSESANENIISSEQKSDNAEMVRSAEPANSSSKVETLDETPRKGAEKVRHNRLAYANKAFSDSKVLSLNRIRSKNRMADRGMSIVRRSILKHKHLPEAKSPTKRPQDHEFQPIRVFQFHSPSASPSAGILKKKRLSASAAVSCSSPPAKERRVSFAEPIISGASPSRHSGPEFVKSKSSLGKKPEEILVDSQPSQSQASFKSTQETSLNCIDPVYPDLVECTESVTKVLPQLTSSVWSRGLGQLVKARNIHTVGDLSKLTEVDIHNLPIRSPKVVTVRRVLSDLEQHFRRSRDVKSSESEMDQNLKSDAETFKVPSLQASPALDTIEETSETENKENRDDADEPDSLPNMDDALSQLTPKQDDLNSSIEAEPDEPMSCDLPSQSQISTQNPNQSDAVLQQESQTVTMDTKSSESKSDSDISDGERLASSLDDLVKEVDFNKLQKMRTGDLFQVHQHLTHLSNLVITAMKSRCHSPPISK